MVLTSPWAASLQGSFSADFCQLSLESRFCHGNNLLAENTSIAMETVPHSWILISASSWDGSAAVVDEPLSLCEQLGLSECSG